MEKSLRSLELLGWEKHWYAIAFSILLILRVWRLAG